MKVKKILPKKFHRLRLATTANNKADFLRSFNRLHPRDRAEYVFNQEAKVRKRIYAYLSAEQLAEVFESIELEKRIVYLPELVSSQAAAVLSEMYVDDAVDVLNALETEVSNQYLSLMDDAVVREMRELLYYREDTAGSIMTTEFVSVNESATVSEALAKIKSEALDAVTVYYTFVISDDGRLIDVVSLKALLLAKPSALVREFGQDHVVSISANAPKEQAAKLIRDYNFLALPVIDFHQRLLGVITVDDVVDLIDEEAADDYSKLAAVSDVEITDSAFTSAKKRLPWLILLLFLGMLTATLIGQFETTIAQVAILGAFIPVVAGTTGNSGTQSLAIVVRGIATGELAELSLRRYFTKEAVTALMTSVVCGLVLAAIIYIWKEQMIMGVVAGVSLTLSIFVGTLAGSAVPLMMSKLKVDPAVASGPLITTICDIISMGIYFGIATALLSYLL